MPRADPVRYGKAWRAETDHACRNPDEKFSASELRLLVAALSQCLQEILNKADPGFRPEMLASFDAMAARLRNRAG